MPPLSDTDRVISVCEDKLGVIPKPEQLDVLRSIIDRRDCVLIAPTGWGKTLAFTLPLFLWSDAAILVITPLKALGIEQRDKLKNLNIECVSITEDDKDINASKVLQGGYRAIFLSPEMLLESKRLKGLWENSKWAESIRAVVVDEAHCIHAWGSSFRHAFGELAKLRYRLNNRAPFIAASATLPRSILKTTILSLDMMNPTIINIGNDRPNIMYKVTSFKEAVSSFKDLLFLKDKAKTIVYFDNRDLAEQAGHLLRTWFGQEQVRVYHGFKTDDLKNRRMKEFREGKYPILLATEAADPVQQDLKDLIDLANSPGCIRKYFNDYYGNEHVPVTDVCCNICNPDEADDKDESSTIQPADKASKREKWDKNEAEQVRNALIVWRDNMYDLHFKGRMHDTEQTVMTDYMLNKTVKKYKSIIAARSIDMLYWDPLNETYPSQVLEIIMGLGKQFLEEKDEKEKKIAKKRSDGGNLEWPHLFKFLL
ncbi:hypothetical protein EMPS_01866 [Entomortierella parvispora]|uniref:DNA 3'-5' helicase n=2 Tax=Entomortierella parvispora TaxID=205924 RepID=A0A9P3LTD1_9FUNG|nr:hypothetical protein EMPS_01866 [Entomortierella parvispora]